MTPLVFLLLALAGGVGAGLRFLIDGLIRSRITTGFQWATTIINASGSLVLGFLTGLTLVHVLPTDLSIVVGTGLLGGYTTFSTASYETVQLIQEKRYGAAFVSGVVMLALCVMLAVFGVWLGASI